MVSSSLNVECDNIVAKVLVPLLEQPFRHLGGEDVVEVPHRLYDLEIEKILYTCYVKQLTKCM